MRSNGTITTPERPYRPWWKAEQVQQALERGTVVAGELRVNAKQPGEAFVRSVHHKRDIFIQREQLRNRALDGDLVAVLVKTRPRRNSNSAAVPVAVQDSCSEPSTSDGSSLGASAELERDKALGTLPLGQPRTHLEPAEGPEPEHLCGRVVAVLERHQPRYIFGRVERHDSLLCLSPDDRRLPRFQIELVGFCARARERLYRSVGHLAVATFTGRWHTHDTFPRCALLRLWDESDDLAAGMSLIRYKFSVPPATASCWIPLSKAVAWDASAAGTAWDACSKSRNIRDWRDAVRAFTIDPETSRDLDDALSVRWDPDANGYRVGIHIADVSAYVQTGTVLDEEAARRGTSFYFMDHAVPMLPPALSEDLCSLLPGRDRRTVSVEILLTTDGTVQGEPWIGRGLIRSCAKLSYQQVQRILRDRDPSQVSDPLIADVHLLYRLAMQRRQQRRARGALLQFQRQLSLERVRAIRSFANLKKTGEPDGAHWLVEEFMLLANEQIARFLQRHCPREALLRRHPPFDKTLVERITQWATKRGLAFTASDTQALQTSLDALADTAPIAMIVLRNKLTKAMATAEYICAGAFDDAAAYRHTALDLDVYTHFTSPIRRYADIIVHRQVLSVLDAPSEARSGSQKPVAQQVEAVSAIAAHCNQRKKDADAAESAAAWLHLAQELQVEPLECDAIIGGFPNSCRCLNVYVPVLDLEVVLDFTRDLGASVCLQTRDPVTGLEELELEWPVHTLRPYGLDEARTSFIVGLGKSSGAHPAASQVSEAWTIRVRLRELDTCRVLVSGETRPYVHARVQLILDRCSPADAQRYVLRVASVPCLLTESDHDLLD